MNFNKLMASAPLTASELALLHQINALSKQILALQEKDKHQETKVLNLEKRVLEVEIEKSKVISKDEFPSFSLHDFQEFLTTKMNQELETELKKEEFSHLKTMRFLLNILLTKFLHRFVILGA